MRAYRYTFLGLDGRLTAALMLHAGSDEDACELGSELLSKSECSALEITQADKVIFLIGRDDKQNPRVKPETNRTRVESLIKAV
jgi:hypothetical protein